MLNERLITGNIKPDPAMVEAQRAQATTTWKAIWEGIAWLGVTIAIGVYLVFYFIVKATIGMVNDN